MGQNMGWFDAALKISMLGRQTMDQGKTFVDALEHQGVWMTPEERERLAAKLNKILNYVPRVGIMGKTGVGKSSLCNALFGEKHCAISAVEACTRRSEDIPLGIGNKKIFLVDVPGVGEDRDRDREYAKLYQELLPELDAVLWLIKADDRANADDLDFYQYILKPHLDQNKPFFFVASQADKIDPCREWNDAAHEPGPIQFHNIEKKRIYIASQFDVPPSRVVPISAAEKFNLVPLMDAIISDLPKEKKITVLRAVNDEVRSEAATQDTKESFLDTLEYLVDSAAIDIQVGLLNIGDKISEAKDNVSSWFWSWWPF